MKTNREIAEGLVQVKMLSQFLNDPRRLGMTEEKQKAVVDRIENVGTDPNAQTMITNIEKKVKEGREL